jgi:hypothetical protein
MTDRIRIIKHEASQIAKSSSALLAHLCSALWRPEHGDSYEYAAMVPSAGPIDK